MKILTKASILGILLLGSSTFYSFNLMAQRATFGVRFMPTISSFDMKTTDGATVKGEVSFGYGLGGLIGYNFNQHVGIQAELIYSSINQKYQERDVERKINLKYMNIPLLLSLNTGISKDVNLNFVAGPQMGIKTGGSVSSSGGDGTESNAVLSVKAGDLGFAYGAGLDFGLNPARTTRFGIGFRGVYGLIDISENSPQLQTNSYYIVDKAHVKTYSLYFGFSFLI